MIDLNDRISFRDNQKLKGIDLSEEIFYQHPNNKVFKDQMIKCEQI